MPLTNSYLYVAKDVQARLEVAKTDLGLADIFYGDQDRIPRTPTVCVEPGSKNRDLNGHPRRTEVRFTTYLIVYHYMVRSTEEIREANDDLAEDIETLLHLDAQLRDSEGEPTVIDSIVSSIESGYQQKRNSLFRASRLTFEARSQIHLPVANTP